MFIPPSGGLVILLLKFNIKQIKIQQKNTKAKNKADSKRQMENGRWCEIGLNKKHQSPKT